MSFEVARVEVAGRSVHLHAGGDDAAPALLLLHSEFGDALWTPFHDALGERRRVLAPAHPGTLGSTGEDDLQDVEDVVLHYLDLLDVLGVERVDLVGEGIGGWIAAELAWRYPARVRSLALLGALGLHVPGHPVAELFVTDGAELVPKVFVDPTHPFAAFLGMDLESGPPEEVVVALARAMSFVGRIGWDPYLHNPRLPSRLARVRAPTVVVWGDRDGITAPAHGELYARSIPGARLVVIPACGHLPSLERPEETLAALRPVF